MPRTVEPVSDGLWGFRGKQSLSGQFLWHSELRLCDSGHLWLRRDQHHGGWIFRLSTHWRKIQIIFQVRNQGPGWEPSLMLITTLSREFTWGSQENFSIPSKDSAIHDLTSQHGYTEGQAPNMWALGDTPNHIKAHLLHIIMLLLPKCDKLGISRLAWQVGG